MKALVAGLALGAGLGWAGSLISAPVYEELPACVHEDGNVNGAPCWWTNSDGVRYYVDSSEYRR